MNSKQILKNQDLFSFTFLESPFKHQYDFQISLKENFKDDIAAMLKEAPSPPNIDVYAEYTLSIAVGKWFFYTALIHVMPYQKRIDFLNYQHEKAVDKMSFLHRVEALSQVDYWYSFGEHSFYNPDAEKLVGDWVVAKYQGKEFSHTPKLNLIKP